MSILVRFAPTSMTTEQYEQVRSGLQEAGHFPPDGMEVHVCFGPEGNLRVSEVWASRERFDQFAEQQLMRRIGEAGIEGGEPEFLDVHNLVVP